MKLEWEGVSPLLVLSTGLVLISSLFQVGYFVRFGIDFLSTVSVGDWIFFSGILAVPLFFLVGLFGAIFSDRRETRERIWFGRGFVAMTVVASVFMLRAFEAPWLLAIFVALVIMATWASFRPGSVLLESTNRMFPLAVASLWGSLAFVSGSVYADLGGTICVFRFDDGRELRAVYKRSVADGHLMVLGGVRYFLAKDGVKELKCETAKRSEVRTLQGLIDNLTP